MRWTRAALAALFVATALADGSIDATNATIDSGDAPTKGVVTIDAAARPSVPPRIPPVDSLGAPPAPPDPLPPFPGGGSGADGAFAATADIEIPGGTYEYTSYSVPDGVTVSYSSAVEIRTTGDVSIAGTVRGIYSTTFVCGGDFLVTPGTATDAIAVAGTGGLHVFGSRIVEATGARSLSCDDGDVHVENHLQFGTYDCRGITLDQGASLKAGKAVRIRAECDVVLDHGASVVGGVGADVSIVAYHVGVSGGSTVDASGLGGLTLSGDLALHDSAVRTAGGALRLTDASGNPRPIYPGSSIWIDRSQVSAAGAGDVFAEAWYGDVWVDSGSRVAATGTGGVRLTSPESISIFSTSGADDTLVSAGAGGVFLGADADPLGGLRVSINGRAGVVTASGGPVDVRGGLSLSGYATIAASGDVDVRGGLAGNPDASNFPYLSGGSVAISGAYVEGSFGPLTATSGALSIVAEDGVLLRGECRSAGPLTIASASGAVDVAGATIHTTDAGAAESAPVLVECVAPIIGPPAPEIRAVGATIRSGASDVRSGAVTLRTRRALATPVESFLLLDSARFGVAAGRRWGVALQGELDLGVDPVDLSQPLTVWLNDWPVAAGVLLRPDRVGPAWRLTDPALPIELRPSPDGSSRCGLRLAFRGDVPADVPAASELTVRVQIGALDVSGTVRLTKGKFSRRASPQDVLAPTLALVSAAGLAPRSGKDTLALSLAFAGVPATPGTISVNCADVLTMSAEPSSFRVWRGAFRVRGATTGLAVAPLDERISIAGRALDLSALGDGPAVVAVTVGVGDDIRSVRVRLGRRGARLVY